MERHQRRRRPWPLELCVLAGAYWVYRQARIAVTGSRAVALVHAGQVVGLERRLGLLWEDRLHRAVVQHPSLLAACNWYYGNVHFVAPAVVLLVLFLREPARYGRWRNVFAAVLALGLVCFALYAVVPPWALHGASQVDGARIPKPAAAFSWSADNPYAAMPSLHVAWASWCTAALWPLAESTGQRIGLAVYPLVTVFVVVATGNHYLLDVVAGGVTLAAAWKLVQVFGPSARSGEPATQATHS